MKTPTLAAVLAIAGSIAVAGQTIDVSSHRMVDLSHVYGAEHSLLAHVADEIHPRVAREGQTEGGYFYSANTLSTPEHGGTHLDAPFHFSESGRTTEQIPLEQLIAPAVVIDVRTQTSADRDYRLTRADVMQFEKTHGTITAGTIVLLRTGWSRHWPNAKAYLGDDTPGDASKLSFPSYGADAAKLLVEERAVAAIGIDTASIDYGKSTAFEVHRIAAAKNVPGMENLTNLDQLPPRGALVIALPMKIEKGSGGPLRAIALVPR